MNPRFRPPFLIPQWFLTLKYAVISLIGLGAALASSPSLDLTIGDPLTTAWGFVVFLVGVLAVIGSRLRTEVLERWTASLLFVLLVVYAFSPVLIILTEGDTDRLTYSLTAFGLSMLVGLRTWDLLSRTGLAWRREPKADEQ